jgi:hypothetical protein
VTEHEQRDLTDTGAEHSADAATAAAASDTPGATPQYGVGPFSIREVALAAVWLVAFIVSFFPVYGPIGDGVSVWTSGIDWILTIGVPTVAVFLIGLRRLSPQGIRRVGSLGIDQFASVAFSVSAIVWIGTIWNSFVDVPGGRVFVATWVVWVEVVLMLVGVVLTVFAPLLPTLRQDFADRPEIPAHRNARPVRPVTARPPRPAQPRTATAGAPAAFPSDADQYPYGEDPDIEVAPGQPAAGDPMAVFEEHPTAVLPADERGEAENFSDISVEPAAVVPEQQQPVSSAPVTEAFWALAPVERDVVDASGAPLFRIGPDAWALVIEDRGEVFVVRHEDGRVGYLHDTSGVIRG